MTELPDQIKAICPIHDEWMFKKNDEYNFYSCGYYEIASCPYGWSFEQMMENPDGGNVIYLPGEYEPYVWFHEAHHKDSEECAKNALNALGIIVGKIKAKRLNSRDL